MTIATNNKYDEWIELNKKQDFAIDKMFYCMDRNNNTGFSFYFDLWHIVTSELIINPYNECGHKLCDELMDYAKTNCKGIFSIYYPDEC